MVIFCTHCAGLETCKIYMSPYLWCAPLKLSLTSFITVAVSVPVSECVEIIIVVIIVERQRFVFSVHFNVVPFACHSPSLRNLIWGDSQTFPHCHLIWPSHGELSPPPSLTHSKQPACARNHSTLRLFITIITEWRAAEELCQRRVRGRLPSLPQTNRLCMDSNDGWGSREM